jgi:hypothetical protein
MEHAESAAARADNGARSVTAKEAKVLRAANDGGLTMLTAAGAAYRKWQSVQTGTVDALTRRLIGEGLLKVGPASGRGSLAKRHAVLTDAGMTALVAHAEADAGA